jgi:hypothetical protein
MGHEQTRCKDRTSHVAPVGEEGQDSITFIARSLLGQRNCTFNVYEVGVVTLLVMMTVMMFSYLSQPR